MADVLRQGLEISAIGLGLTFGALGMLILAMMLLERLFRPKSSAAKEPLPTLVETVPGDRVEEEIAAAIGVALVYWRWQADRRGDLGQRLEFGRGGWWKSARSVSTSRFASKKAHRE